MVAGTRRACADAKTLLREEISHQLILMTDEFSEIELRRLDLNLLLVFSAVMRERSVGRAAARLYLGPSAISMALARLRENLGDALFVRAGRRVVPTPRAEQLWAELEPALSRIEAAVRGSRGFEPARSAAVFRLAAPDDLEFVLVPLLLDRLARVAPGVRLVLRPADFRTLLDRLDSGDADLGLSATPERGIERRHRIRPLYREGFAVLFDSARVAGGAPIGLEAYLATPQLLLSVSGELSGPVDQRLAEMGRERRVIAALSHFPTMPFVLRARPSLVNMPATAARYVAAAYGLTLSPPPLALPDFEVSLAWHAGTDGDPAQAWFREFVATAVLDLYRGSGDGQ